MNDTKTNNGGPAFSRGMDSFGEVENGMSLRDYFAGQALIGLLSDQKRDGSFTAYADDAYAFANAMLTARNS